MFKQLVVDRFKIVFIILTLLVVKYCDNSEEKKAMQTSRVRNSREKKIVLEDR